MNAYNEFRQEVQSERPDVAKAVLNLYLRRDGFAREMLEALQDRLKVEWFVGLYLGEWIISHPEWVVSDLRGGEDFATPVLRLVAAILDFTSLVYTDAPNARNLLEKEGLAIWQALPGRVRDEIGAKLRQLFSKLRELSFVAYPDPEPEPAPEPQPPVSSRRGKVPWYTAMM